MNEAEIPAFARRQALTAIIPVLPGQLAGLEAKLKLRRNEWATGLRGCSGVHFAKLALIPPPEKQTEPYGLLLETSFDGELAWHLSELWDHAGSAYADLLTCCEGGEQLDRERFFMLVERSARRVAAACSAHGALSRAVVDNDAELDRLVQAFLDRSQREARYRLGPALEVVKRLREQLEATERIWVGSLELEAAPVEPRGVVGRFACSLARLGLRRKAGVELDGAERRSAGSALQTSSLLLVPAPRGRLRRWALAALLAELSAGAEPDPGAEPRVHAARWVMLADGRLLVSLTHDGTSEAFRALLPERAPRDLWLPEGAVELYPQIWYSAYPDLSVNDVLRNHRMRELLARPHDNGSASALCALF